VATPSFNQGEYLEETIRSVLLQGYPNLEYLVIDGGSGDGSVGVIEKYAPWLSYWCSEKDRGQTHALIKSLDRATGDVFNWINSDDSLTPGALFKVANAFQNCDVVAGMCLDFDPAGRRTLVPNAQLNPLDLISGREHSVFHQPSLWWRREWITACGGLDEDFDLAFDYDLLLRFLARRPRISYLEDVLAHFRLHPGSKTCSRVEEYGPERELILKKLAARDDLPVLQKACRRRVRQLEWWREVERLRSENGGSRLAQAAHLGWGAMADPVVRMNRFTLGALRRILSWQRRGELR
jgi:glycosyltransferase involved in cell wall biosynthesis